jgi:hypothetical protein
MPARPRYELDNACVMKGWNDGDLAARLDPKVNAETVRRWRTGEQTPYKYHITQMCVLFEVKHPKELNLDAQFNALTQSREETIAVYRREFFEYLKATSIVAGVEPVVLLSATVDDPKEFLGACRVVLDECWDQHNRQKRSALADNTITALMPSLRELAMKPSSSQHEAAALALEAKVLQIRIATRKEDYKRRVSLGSDIVLIGKASGDKNLHAMAAGWHGNTYVNCYFVPEAAIAIYKSILPFLTDVSPLNQADIYMGLATACALDENDADKEATKTRDYITLARMAMPDNPEADPLYPGICMGQAELDLREGETNLILARRFPSKKEYTQRAYESLMKSASQEAMDIWYRSGTLIRQAEAALCVLNREQFFDGLEEGIHIAIQTGNQRLISRAVAVIQKAPLKWRNEKRYQDLDAIVQEIMRPTKIRR